jgi:hypothetical protein
MKEMHRRDWTVEVNTSEEMCVALRVREVFGDEADEELAEVGPLTHEACKNWAFEVRQNILDNY